MRVAVAHNLPPGGAIRTLGEQVRRTSMDVQAVYSLKGCEVLPGEFGCGSVQYQAAAKRPLGFPLGRLNGVVNTANLRAVDKAFRRMAKDIDCTGYDVVLAHPCRISQAPALLRYLRTPTVYYCHEPFRAMHEAVIRGGPFLPTSDPLRCVYSRCAIEAEFKSLKAATAVVANSHYTREYLLRSYGVDSIVNHPGVDTELFTPLDAQKEDMVLSIGRLSVLKGHEFVIESLATIGERHRPSLHIVCGPSSSEKDKGRIESYARRCGVNLTMETDIDDKELVELYNRAAVTVVASILEPFGLVPLESMACGTPVVAVAEGGIRETVVDGVTGFLTGRVPVDFGEAVRRLFDNSGMASEMGRAGREAALKRWSWDVSVRQLDSMICDVVEKVS